MTGHAPEPHDPLDVEMARYLLHYQLPPSEFWSLTRAQKDAIRHTAEAINQERK